MPCHNKNKPTRKATMGFQVYLESLMYPLVSYRGFYTAPKKVLHRSLWRRNEPRPTDSVAARNPSGLPR